jgi:hypothetical protein
MNEDGFLRALENSFLRNEIRSSHESLDKLLANDFLEFGQSGDERLGGRCDRPSFAMRGEGVN